MGVKLDSKQVWLSMELLNESISLNLEKEEPLSREGQEQLLPLRSQDKDGARSL